MIMFMNQSALNLYPVFLIQASIPIFSLLIILLMFKYILEKQRNKSLTKKVLRAINISIIPLLILFVVIVSYNSIILYNALYG